MEECSRIGRVLVSLQYLSCQIKVTNWKLVEALSFPKTRASPKTETPTRTVWDWVVLITENPSPCLVLGKVAILYQTLRAEEDPFWLDSYYSCNSVSSHLCSVTSWVPTALVRPEEMFITIICSDYSAQRCQDGVKVLAVTLALYRWMVVFHLVP